MTPALAVVCNFNVGKINFKTDMAIIATVKTIHAITSAKEVVGKPAFTCPAFTKIT